MLKQIEGMIYLSINISKGDENGGRKKRKDSLDCSKKSGRILTMYKPQKC